MNKPCSLLLLLALASIGTSCSLAVKSGIHRFNNSALEAARDDPSLTTWEIEFGVREFLDEKIDLSLGVNLIQSVPGSDFQDYRLTGRYHFRNAKRIVPYAGGGLGWYRMFTKDLQVFTPNCTALFLPPGCVGIAEQDRTLASGLNPHAVAGMRVAITRSVDFVVEDRFDFGKDDIGLDFDSNQITAGVRLDFMTQRPGPRRKKKAP